MNDKIEFAVPENIAKIVVNGGSVTRDETRGVLLFPANCVITKTDGILLSLPYGGTVSDDGTVTAQEEVTITEPSGVETTIFIPTRKSVIVRPNGNVDKPFGSAVIVAIPGRQPKAYFMRPPITF